MDGLSHFEALIPEIIVSKRHIRHDSAGLKERKNPLLGQFEFLYFFNNKLVNCPEPPFRKIGFLTINDSIVHEHPPVQSNFSKYLIPV